MLELAIAHTLYDRFPDYDEGQMAKLRSHVVSRASCAVVSAELGLGERLLASKTGPDSGEQSRLVGNRNVLAAVLEAALAALYLEHGFEPIAGRDRRGVREPDPVRADQPGRPQDRAPGDARPGGRLAPTCSSTSDGPPHERLFTSAAMVDGEQAGVGRGSSKKDAEQQAAREALEQLAAAAGEPAAETG